MTTVEGWPAGISLHEEDGKTRAEAGLTRDGVGKIGHGLARRNPDDQEVTQMGGDRGRPGLSDPAHQLLSDAAGQIEGITHERAHLSIDAARSPGAVRT